MLTTSTASHPAGALNTSWDYSFSFHSRMVRSRPPALTARPSPHTSTLPGAAACPNRASIWTRSRASQCNTFRSAPAESSSPLPASGLNARPVTLALWLRSVYSGRYRPSALDATARPFPLRRAPAATTAPSLLLADTGLLPLLCVAAPVTLELLTVPVLPTADPSPDPGTRIFHNRTVKSSPPLATIAPSDEIDTARTAAKCPPLARSSLDMDPADRPTDIDGSLLSVPPSVSRPAGGKAAVGPSKSTTPICSACLPALSPAAGPYPFLAASARAPVGRRPPRACTTAAASARVRRRPAQRSRRPEARSHTHRVQSLEPVTAIAPAGGNVGGRAPVRSPAEAEDICISACTPSRELPSRAEAEDGLQLATQVGGNCEEVHGGSTW